MDAALRRDGDDELMSWGHSVRVGAVGDVMAVT